MNLRIRAGGPCDAPAMCALLNAIILQGVVTANHQPCDEAEMVLRYIHPALGITCVVALDGDVLIGFQALQHPSKDWPVIRPLPATWAVIASFVMDGYRRRGVGRTMFAATRRAAILAGVPTIIGTTLHDNSIGQQFYASLGFHDWCEEPATLSQRIDLPAMP